jgi:pyridinium-3,5-biscarboxylic acid mononucleotide sulfurtransferase
LDEIINNIQAHIQEGVCIAFSGGVDSSLLLKIACEIGKKANRFVLAVTFETKLHPHGEIEEARAMAKSFGAIHRTIAIDEFKDPEIIRNPIDRCYRCKTVLFQTLIDYGKKEGYHYFIDGSNYDDLKAYRPGMQALKELGIHSPLLELKVTKEKIRALAAQLGVTSHNRPAAPCLATRLPYGTKFDFDLLEAIDLGEKFIRDLGFYNVRLRLHGDIIRIEIDTDDLLKFISIKDRVIKKLKDLGFFYITLDLEGFRSGSMDIHLKK